MFTQENWGIYLIGFTAQILFSLRLLIQWLLSERKKSVQSPGIYWILSIAGAFMLTLYGWFREDFAIILGQFITYYIYMWNMHRKKIWTPIPVSVRWILILMPVVALGFVLRDAGTFFQSFFHNPEVGAGLLLFGSAGQIIFTLRFVYQIIYSYRRGESMLPVGFWILSLAGASTIMAYGFFRSDPVIILGQSCGWIIYLRNIMIWCRQNRAATLKPSKP
ncbi:MAG: lipid-A-disaccharide synthase N-terminal domain-containing protein [Bacteroides sp.]|nr:lipid-A-disaccharide synthase N-terminal domain-containing protein [Bacteroides sp.]MCM1085824.1 lipid-A-disaccharide synthase N-terminal domain-containing protein [Bacteroides sp.]